MNVEIHIENCIYRPYSYISPGPGVHLIQKNTKRKSNIKNDNKCSEIAFLLEKKK